MSIIPASRWPGSSLLWRYWPGGRKSGLPPAAGSEAQADKSASEHRITTTTPIDQTAGLIRHQLRGADVTLSGEFSRIKALYSALVAQMALAERGRLAGLQVALAAGEPQLTGLPARRAGRRIGRRSQAGTFPLEHLLLTSDFAQAERILETLFADAKWARARARAEFRDPKGNLSLGQYRDILALIAGQVPEPTEPALQDVELRYVIERWADHRTFRPAVLIPAGAGRVMIDVAQLEGKGEFAAALAQATAGAHSGQGMRRLEPEFVSYGRSCVWAFNRAFWRYLGIWERATGKSYQRALPKGKSESHHQEFIEQAGANFAAHVFELEREGGLAPDQELWFHEKAPGSGEFTAGLLDYLREHQPNYYRRMRVVLSDVSAQVLKLAEAQLRARGHSPAAPDVSNSPAAPDVSNSPAAPDVSNSPAAPDVSNSPAAPDSAWSGPQVYFRDVSVDPEPRVKAADGAEIALAGRFLYYRNANFLDQLPTRLFARDGATMCEVEVRAAIAAPALARMEKKYGLELAELQALIEDRLDLDGWEPEAQARMIGFWSDVWSELKLEEHYRPVAPEALPALGALALRELGERDQLRFVTSDTASDILMADLELLDPLYGYACCTDIFLQRAAEFQERWIELAKYDNGVWVGTNGLVLAALLAERGFETGYYPVELTLGEPTPVYTLTARKIQDPGFALSATLLQQLTSIEHGRLGDVTLYGLSRRARNNLRELPANLHRLIRDRDWSLRLTRDLDLTTLLRELYYRTPGAAMDRESGFVKLTVLLAEVLCRHPGQMVDFRVDLQEDELKDLEDFLAHRPLDNLPLDLIEIRASDAPGALSPDRERALGRPEGPLEPSANGGRANGNHANGNPANSNPAREAGYRNGAGGAATVEMRLRLPTLARLLEDGDFVLMAEVDLPRGQSLDQMRRRIFQFQSHVDAISITSGRLADPRFVRSRELTDAPIVSALRPDALMLTLEMRDRRAAALEADLRRFEQRGIRNFFIVSGDFERSSRWWLDSLHGIQIADRVRNQEGLEGAPAYLRSRTVIAAALAWSGIPDLQSRIERDVMLKLAAGADLLLTQPVYDLGRALEAFRLIEEAGLARRVHIVPELFPISTLEQLRVLGEAPGILIPPALAAAYRRINSNLGRLWQETRAPEAAPEARRQAFPQTLFAGVEPPADYRELLTAEFADRLYDNVQAAAEGARRKNLGAAEDAQALKAARETVLYELGFLFTCHAMAVLSRHALVSGYLFVARNGRELKRLTAAARRITLATRRAPVSAEMAEISRD